MSHPLLYKSSLAISLIPALFGLNGMFRPDAHLRALYFPAHSDPTAHKLSHALMRIWAIRNLSISFLLSIVWSVGDEKLMGTAMGAGLAICITDGFVSRALIGGGEGQHWGFAPVLAGMMSGLLGWW